MMNWKHLIALLLLLVVAHVSPAQTVTTVASSNVTSWAAQLHGSYDSLATNETYELSFAYGQADGGTNLGSWSYQSSSVILSGGSTGAYSRTVIELDGTNTYYFRGLAETTNATLWATQSLTFVTAGTAPTSTPPVQYLAVMVDTNGLLVGPTNFFIINGILPTQSVQAISIGIASNAAVAQNLLTNALQKRPDGTIQIPPRSNQIYMVSTPLVFEHIGGSLNQTNKYFVWFNGTDMYGATGSVYGATIGRRFWTDWNAETLLTTMLPTLSIIDSMSITNRAAWGYYAAGDDIVGNSLSVDNDLIITNRGANTIIDYKGFGSLVITYGGATQMIFSGTSIVMPGKSLGAGTVTATNGHSYFGSLSGNADGLGGPLTNIGLAGLRLANTYTGGVMSLKTTDGTSFFLE